MALADCCLLKCGSRSWSSWPPLAYSLLLSLYVVLGGVMVTVLATGPNDRGFKRGRQRRISNGDKNSLVRLPSDGK
jgi:hypothetical protein